MGEWNSHQAAEKKPFFTQLDQLLLIQKRLLFTGIFIFLTLFSLTIFNNTSMAVAAQSRSLQITTRYPHFPGNGTFRIGKDIQPGTYRTRQAMSGCYYARLSGFGGTVGEIIANNLTNAPAIVTIASTDKGFETSGCPTWTKDLSAITKSKTTFRDGMYIVRTDILPGQYRTLKGTSGCYYARLRGFGGTVNDIVTNNITNAPAIVTISKTDKGFEASGCATWVKS